LKKNGGMMKHLFLSLLFTVSYQIFAQSDSIKQTIVLSGYLETYYGFDFANPADHSRPIFFSSHTRHNEVNLNLAFVKASYQKESLRANLALMTGTYANSNLASEPGVLKNIFEANAGIKLSPNKNLWVDIGVFASHIGFENAIGNSCWNLSRSIMSDNSPYYESGLKLAYTSQNHKWFVSGLILNGWQQIQRSYGNNSPSFGHQLTWKPSTQVTLNSSSFLGSVAPDSFALQRYFHNFFAIIEPTEKFGFIAGFDIGTQQNSKNQAVFQHWYALAVIVRYKLSSKFITSARAEYYSDKNAIIIPSNSGRGFNTLSYSLNFDYRISENALWRIEGKVLSSDEKVYVQENKLTPQNYWVCTALALSF
jgi:hypothetical protein